MKVKIYLKPSLRYVTIIYMKKYDKIYVAFWIRITRPMRFILADDGERLLGYLTINIIKHIFMRRMICAHLISAHVSNMISLVERIEYEVNIVKQMVTNGSRFKILSSISCSNIQFYRTSIIVYNSQRRFADSC